MQRVLDHKETTVGDTPKSLADMGFSTDHINIAEAVMVYTEGNGIRYRFDGLGDPSGTSRLLADGESMILTEKFMVSRLKVVADSGTAKVVIDLCQ